MARWLSWLERRPVTAEVVGSNPIRVAETEKFQNNLINGILAQLGEHLPKKERRTRQGVQRERKGQDARKQRNTLSDVSLYLQNHI